MERVINERIKSVIENLKISETRFSEEIGIPQSTISNIFNRDSDPKFSVISAIVTRYDFISLEWLLLGIGNMEKSPSSKNIENQLTSDVHVISNVLLNDENTLLQKKVVELLEENMALQKKIIELLEENKKLQEDDPLDYTDMSMGEKMIEEMGEVVKKIAKNAKGVSQRTKKVIPKKAM